MRYINHKTKRILTFLIVISIATIFAGCNKKDENIETFSGTVEAREINVNAEVGGKIADIAITEGSRVKQGQLICKIDSTLQALQVQQAEAALTAAREKSKETKKGSREEQIAQAEAAVKQFSSMEEGARLSMNNAKDNLDRVQKLFQEGGSTSQQLTDAESKYEIAKAQLASYTAQKNSAIEQLRLLKNGSTQETINIADAGVTQAQAAYLTAKAQMEKTLLKSSVSGVVDSVNFNRGEYISPGSAVATIIDTKDMWINVYVPEKELPKIKLGQRAKINIDAYPDKQVHGMVEFISSKAEFTPKNLQTKEERVNMVFAVKVKITDGLNLVRPGLPADVEIVIE